MRGKSAVLLSLIMLIAGFLISFSFQMTKENSKSAAETEEWKKEYALRDELLKQEKENKNLEKELYQKQNKVRQAENKLKKERRNTITSSKIQKNIECILGKSVCRERALR